jgi:hypothetical protein
LGRLERDGATRLPRRWTLLAMGMLGSREDCVGALLCDGAL